MFILQKYISDQSYELQGRIQYKEDICIQFSYIKVYWITL